MPPKVDQAAHEAAERTRKAARQAADYSRPRIEQAGARAAGPVREEAAARSAAALAALRGQVTPKEIEKLVRKHRAAGPGGHASPRRWPSRASWRAVPSPPGSGGTSRPTPTGWSSRRPRPRCPTTGALTSVDGSGQAVLDPEVQAKQAEEDAARHDEGR